MELINNSTGETVVFEPDENNVITIPEGEWRFNNPPMVIPEGVSLVFSRGVVVTND